MKNWTLWLGIVLAIGTGLSLWELGESREVAWTAGTVVLCAVWWIFEPIPIAATSLLPLAIFPLTGVLTSAQAGEAYGHSLVLLMLGGFMLSMAMERSGAHRRIAVGMVQLCGRHGSGRGLVFGFMAAAALLSMWISNSATALMLLPIVTAVNERTDNRTLHTCLLLGVAYACSIGGIGTPIGTPPNLVFMGALEALGQETPSFATWMAWALPIVAVMLPLTGWWLTRRLTLEEPIELPEVGRWRSEEIRILAVFAVTALLWMTREEPFGGWSGLAGLPQANDASVALLAVVALHVLPGGNGKPLLTWDAAVKIPWGILILYGGGIAIARAFVSSGLSATIGESLTSLASVPTLLMIAAICLAVTFLTEVTSNTATANLLLPILAATAISIEVDPRLIMFPAAISASFAFMLPVATPPNAIVFSSEQLTIRHMAREGLLLNLLGAVVVTIACWLLFG